MSIADSVDTNFSVFLFCFSTFFLCFSFDQKNVCECSSERTDFTAKESKVDSQHLRSGTCEKQKESKERKKEKKRFCLFQ